jgi:hypothetical protein
MLTSYENKIKRIFFDKSNFIKNHNKKNKQKENEKKKKHVFKQEKKINEKNIITIHNILFCEKS